MQRLNHGLLPEGVEGRTEEPIGMEDMNCQSGTRFRTSMSKTQPDANRERQQTLIVLDEPHDLRPANYGNFRIASLKPLVRLESENDLYGLRLR